MFVVCLFACFFVCFFVCLCMCVMCMYVYLLVLVSVGADVHVSVPSLCLTKTNPPMLVRQFSFCETMHYRRGGVLDRDLEVLERERERDRRRGDLERLRRETPPSTFTLMKELSPSCDLNLVSSRFFNAHSMSSFREYSTIPIPSRKTSA